MSKFDNGCPFCGGILWHLEECPNYVDRHEYPDPEEEYEPEGIVCDYCGNEIPDGVRVIEGHDEDGDFCMCERCIRYFVAHGALNEVLHALGVDELRTAEEINRKAKVSA